MSDTLSADWPPGGTGKPAAGALGAAGRGGGGGAGRGTAGRGPTPPKLF